MTRPRNPWPRTETASRTLEIWDWLTLTKWPECYAAMRVRWAARQSCARLRAERDTALEALAGVHRVSGRGAGHSTPRETSACVISALLDLRTEREELTAELAAAQRELDAAQRELRALEWLTVRNSEIVTIEEGQIAMHDHDDLADDGVFATYSAAALALGWEGP